MVKVWGVDSLIDNQVERPPGLWVIIGNHNTHSLVGLNSLGTCHSPQLIQVVSSLK
jgi:hypothetical protein